MAGLKSITNRIINNAEEQAFEIQKEAQAKVSEILQAADADANARMLVAREEAEVEGRRSAERIIAAARLKASKDILAVKREILDRCFVEAKNTLVSLSSDEKEKLISALTKGIPGEKISLPDGGILLKNGDITYNYSFDAIIKIARAKCESDVLKILNFS